ncbi:MAG: PD-(D/E)XK nuclease family protein [Bacteroidales bacterium]|jgi:hypothetical protein|nr:PD-(D/E)XK nuclease family protein [Bacteroidales bacterium]
MNNACSKSFLCNVAQNIVNNNKDTEQITVLLPSRRAILYIRNEIGKASEKPLFAPQFTTIDDWIKNNNILQIADEITLVYHLYLSYCEVFYSYNKGLERESFEQFYFWGKIILSDFDDIDKHLADAKSLFGNLNNYKEIDNNFDFLSQEQKDLLRSFFSAFKAENLSELKQRFINIWNCLAEIYDNFSQRLQVRGLAYSGMLYRMTYEQMINGKINLKNKKFVIAGFNVLSTSEEKIFEFLQQNCSTEFYWDYDLYYINDKLQEAGTFMRENIKKFPNKTFDKLNFDRIKNNQQHITIVDSDGEILQTTYISKWLNNVFEKNNEKDKNEGEKIKQEDLTIILANENLLPVVVKALPDNINEAETNVNITMGYPFAQMDIYAFVEQFISTNAKKLSPVALLENLSEEIFNIYGRIKPNSENKYLIEAAFQVSKKLKELINAFQNAKDETISYTFVQKTLLSELRSLALPFETDPAKGIQIMGLLESRNLDFRHVLMLSASDDFLPNVSSYSTFIPHSIRKAYGLMSIEKRIAVFAYYFYRLFHCAESLTFVYNSSSDTTKAKEMSRFLQQIKIESGKDIKHIKLSATFDMACKKHTSYPKKKEHVDGIMQKKYISPSMFNAFLDCELKFYFKYIVYLDNISYEEEDASALAFGNLFHNSAALLNSLKETDIETLIKLSFEKLVKEEQKAITPVHKDIVKKYLLYISEYNTQIIKREPLLVETEVVKEIEIEIEGKKKRVKLGGIIDRIDYERDSLIVADYKTGGKAEKFDDMDTLFFNEKGNRAIYTFQVLFYCWLLWDNAEFYQEHKKVLQNNDVRFANIKPQIIYIHEIKKVCNAAKEEQSDFFTILRNKEKIVYNQELHKEFDFHIREGIKRLLLFDDEHIYHLNHNEENCTYCDYSLLCIE